MAADEKLPMIKIFWLSPDFEKADNYIIEHQNCKLSHLVWAAAELQKLMMTNMMEADEND